MQRKLALLLLVSMALPLALAQLSRGTLSGTVTDRTGAVIPEAPVLIHNTSTNATYPTKTTATGQYHMPNLPPGPYQIVCETPGFKKLVRSGIQLGATEVLRVDLELEVGQLTESVAVTAEVPRIQNETAEVGTALSNRQLIDLPLNFGSARLAEDFAFKISPGLVGSPSDSHVSGSTSHSKETVLDGASVSTLRAGHFAESSVSVEALGEFKVQTSGMSAEYGRTQAGVFNFVMKSGTNQIHGSAYGGLRNEALNANTFVNNYRGVPRAQDRRHNYALSFGGPVYLPKLYNGTNRSFFYLAYERFKLEEQGFGAASKTAPLPEFYDGDFSRLLGAATGQKDALGRDVLRGAIYDPATFRQLENRRWIGDIFPGNRIPASRFSTVSQRLNAIARQHYLPTERTASGTIPLTNNMLFPRASTPSFHQDQFSLKGDQVISDAHKLSGAFSRTARPRFLVDQGGLWDIKDPEGGPLSKARQQDITSHLGRLAYDWVLSPRVINHVSLSYNRMTEYARNVHVHIDGAKELGIRGLSTSGYPVVNWGGGPFVTLDSPGYTQNTFNAWIGWGFSDTISFARGRHFMKAGVDIRGNHLNYFNEQGGTFNFNAVSTAIPGEPFSGNQTGYAFASYLLGIVYSGSMNDPFALGDRRRYCAGFFQDDFKASDRLTLQLGLRWEYSAPMTEAADRLSSWSSAKIDPESGLPGAYEFAGACSGCTGQRYFGKRDFRAFGPRIGFAWRVAPQWTVRGAYGIFYEGDIPGGKVLSKALSVAWGGTWSLSQDAVTPWAGLFRWDDGFPTDRFVPAAFDASWGNRNNPSMIDPNYGLSPYTQQWNLNVQRQLARNLVVDLGYVGNKSTRLRDGELSRLNQIPASALSHYGRALNNAVRSAADAAANGIPYPYPGFRGTVASAIRSHPQANGNSVVAGYGSPLGFSTYHALQITVNRQFAQGLTTYANYVWSKTLSNVTTSRVSQNQTPLDYYNLKLEKAPPTYDVPHMFKAYLAYELPFGRGRRLWSSAGALPNAVLGGWSVAAILNYFSGAPMGFAGSTPLATGWNGGANRANVAPGAMRNAAFDKSAFELSTPNSSGNTYLNKTLFSDPAPLTLGTAAVRYTQARGFGTINEDFALQKIIRVRENWRIQLRAEALNLFNRSTLGGINTTVTNPLFGQVTSVSGNRQVQVGARLDF